MILEFKGKAHAGNDTLDYCQVIIQAMEVEKNQESPRMSVRYRTEKSEAPSLYTFHVAVAALLSQQSLLSIHCCCCCDPQQCQCHYL